ncbi:hypothetical protein Tco_1239214 [Tanacetum coccineum]
MALDEDRARKLVADDQAELERMQRDRNAQEASIAPINEEWDYKQAVMEADYELAAKLHENEREAMSIEEKSRRLAELIRERKRTWQDTHMQSFDEVQKLFKKHMRWINNFVLMEEDFPTEMVQKEESIQNEESSEKKTKGSRKKSKRADSKLGEESSKRQRMEDDKETEELKKCFELVINDEVTLDVVPLATKHVPIVDYNINTKGELGTAGTNVNAAGLLLLEEFLLSEGKDCQRRVM